MSFGLYLLFTLVILLFFGLWIRHLIVVRLQPQRILGDLESEIQRMVQDINTAGDQNVTVLEDRIESLKTLIRRADIQIEEMEQRLGEIETAKNEERSAEEEAFTIPFRREDPTPDETVKEPRSVGEPTSVEETRSDAEPRSDAESTPRDHIIALHDEGVPSDVIASRMGIAIGEVELIISLATNRPRT